MTKAASRALSSEYAQQTQSSDALPEQLVRRVWRVMADLYGHRWVSAHGESDEDPKRPGEAGMWARGLSGLTGEDLARGFRALMHNGDPWPPSLPQFRALCNPPQRENEAAYRAPPGRMLPHKLSAEERARGRAQIATLRERLK